MKSGSDLLAAAACLFLAGVILGAAVTKRVDSFEWTGRYVLEDADGDTVRAYDFKGRLQSKMSRMEFDERLLSKDLKRVYPWPLPRRFQVVMIASPWPELESQAGRNP